MLLEKLEKIYYRWKQISQQIVDPEIIGDMKRYVKLNREYKDLEPLVAAYKEYNDLLENIEGAKEIIKNETDAEFREMAQVELDEWLQKKERIDEDIKVLLLPKDPEDTKDAILEIRAGTGGDEASLFAGDLFKMYSKYIENKGWKYEVVSVSEGTVGGYKELILNVSGANVYGTLKYESGVHRVQRVPDTEASGRVHTSAASVAVLPEAEEVDVELNNKDIRKDTYRSSGAGGQHVNKTESAVRLTHIPTGIVSECQKERSQIKNYEHALKVLRSKLYEKKLAEKQQEVASKRKTLVSTGDRSAKIRTYNFPQGRVTDHRISLTLYNLEAIIGGDIDEIIEALKVAENAEKLKAGETL